MEWRIHMHTPLHLIFILNEHSRNGKLFSKNSSKVLSQFAVTYEIHKTNKAGHAKQLAVELSSSLKNGTKLIIVGGDGTLNEVINGLESAESKIAVGYVPTGSGNDFARSHQLASNFKSAINHVIELNHPRSLDILKITDGSETLHAVNSFGIGLDGMVNYSLEHSKNKERFGPFSYFSTILSAYFSQKSFSVSITQNSQTIHFAEALLVVSVNHKFFGGGIPIHPKADPEDELIDVVVAEKVSFIELIMLLLRVLINQSHLSHKKLHTFKTSQCITELDSIQYGQTDGEWMEVQGQYKTETKKRLFWI